MTSPHCRICDASEQHQSVRAPHVFGGSEAHHFWQCERCDGIYLFPIPSEEDEKRFYRQEFERFMSTRVGDHRDWSNAEKHIQTNQDQVKRRLPFLDDYLQPGKRLLEIGCSSGFMLDAFAQRGLDVAGVEPSGEFGEFLEQKGFRVNESLDAFEGERFDIITHFFVFEHIRDPFNFVQQNLALLNEGGVMIAEIPCANDPLTSLYDIPAFERFYWSIAHHYYYTPKSLSYVMDQIGAKYKLVPEQRYDLSNHMTWMSQGKPGGQGRYAEALGADVCAAYKKRLIDTWQCDTIFLYVWKQ